MRGRGVTIATNWPKRWLKWFNRPTTRNWYRFVSWSKLKSLIFQCCSLRQTFLKYIDEYSAVWYLKNQMEITWRWHLNSKLTILSQVPHFLPVYQSPIYVWIGSQSFNFLTLSFFLRLLLHYSNWFSNHFRQRWTVLRSNRYGDRVNGMDQIHTPFSGSF